MAEHDAWSNQRLPTLGAEVRLLRGEVRLLRGEVRLLHARHVQVERVASAQAHLVAHQIHRGQAYAVLA
ncbi:hypothetical protein WME95_31990 [Sorangium sp. So ce327]|jgi:hypothetical protein|uniref:hypothetical protein n=1 Tax=unclassified Sorangium TaxID=2621164 RepID=UPI003F612149